MTHASSEKNRKNGGRAVGLVCLMGFVLGGCVVTESKYDAAVADLESARMELEKSRMANDALQRNNEQLQTENNKVAQDLDVMSAEIQRIKESREHERNVLDEREAELEKKSHAVNQAVKQSLKKFQQEYQKTKSQNRALRDTIQRYQKELKEARETRKPGTGSQASAAVSAKKPSASGQSMTKKTRRSGSAPDQDATPLNETVRPVNINTASVQNLVLFLGLNRETAERIVANRPYRLRGELIAKRVLPKVTFDVIRDKITAAPRPRPQ